jgi:molybdopterin-guanine dinucleotide biosynthesis protein A
MGHDKAQLRVRGATENLAERTSRLLLAVAERCVEVGPGYSGREAVAESPPGAGPLVAVSRGWEELRGSGYDRPVLVEATDLPALDVRTLSWLAAHPLPGSVVPYVGGFAQPLCARWSGTDLEIAARLAAEGHRSLRRLLECSQPTLVDPEEPGGPGRQAFADADTPAEAQALGLALPRS